MGLIVQACLAVLCGSGARGGLGIIGSQRQNIRFALNRLSTLLQFAFVHRIVELDLGHQAVVDNQFFQTGASLNLSQQKSAQVKPIEVAKFDCQFAEWAIGNILLSQNIKYLTHGHQLTFYGELPDGCSGGYVFVDDG